MTHAHYRAFLGANTKSGTPLPRPLKVPRLGGEQQQPEQPSGLWTPPTSKPPAKPRTPPTRQEVDAFFAL